MRCVIEAEQRSDNPSGCAESASCYHQEDRLHPPNKLFKEKYYHTDKLTSLRQYTTVVADTGDIAAMKLYQPQDATTQPSLILNAAQIPEYRKLIDDAVAWAKQQSNDRAQQIVDATDKLAVNIGLEILKLVPGRISTELTLVCPTTPTRPSLKQNA